MKKKNKNALLISNRVTWIVAGKQLAARCLFIRNNFDDKKIAPKNKREIFMASKLWMHKDRDASSTLSSAAVANTDK